MAGSGLVNEMGHIWPQLLCLKTEGKAVSKCFLSKIVSVCLNLSAAVLLVALTTLKKSSFFQLYFCISDASSSSFKSNVTASFLTKRWAFFKRIQATLLDCLVGLSFYDAE